MSTPDDTAALLAACKAESERMYRTAPLAVQIGLLELTCIISALQLALRHPRFPAHNRVIVDDVARQLIAGGFRDFPATRALLERGFGPVYDYLIEPPTV